MKLSYDQAQNLHKAIDLAKGSTMCEYAKDGEPYCVIGQFAILQGISIDIVQGWGRFIVDSDSISYMGVSRKFLRTIQSVWDESARWYPTDEDRRVKMHAIVNDAQGIELEE